MGSRYKQFTEDNQKAKSYIQTKMSMITSDKRGWIKTTMKYHHTPMGMTYMKRSQ